MKYESLKDIKEREFRRLTGVKKKTFDEMLVILIEVSKKKRAKGGRPTALCIPDILLMALEYLREYRTYFHIAKSYGISESSAYKNICWVEDTLIKSGYFSLPGKKALLNKESDYEVILIDASEHPIERPKKREKGLKSG